MTYVNTFVALLKLTGEPVHGILLPNGERVGYSYKNRYFYIHIYGKQRTSLELESTLRAAYYCHIQNLSMEEKKEELAYIEERYKEALAARQNKDGLASLHAL